MNEVDAGWRTAGNAKGDPGPHFLTMSLGGVLHRAGIAARRSHQLSCFYSKQPSGDKRAASVELLRGPLARQASQARPSHKKEQKQTGKGA